jgi:Uma2 family endonuclease
MGETDFHVIAMLCLREALEEYFRDTPTVYVATNLVFYFERGNPRGRRDPDVLVAKGVVGKHHRRSFRVWEEGVLPCTLFELASENTWREDVGPKRRQYARLNIPEYFVFDPESAFLTPVLRGFRSVNGRSLAMRPAPDGSLVSEQLGLRLVPEGSLLRLYDLRTGLRVPTPGERAEQHRAEAEEHRAEAEQQRHDAELARRRERRHLRRAEDERRRADELAAEVARLRAEQGGGKKRK